MTPNSSKSLNASNQQGRVIPVVKICTKRTPGAMHAWPGEENGGGNSIDFKILGHFRAHSIALLTVCTHDLFILALGPKLGPIIGPKFGPIVPFKQRNKE